jgi:hypothetical protein
VIGDLAILGLDDMFLCKMSGGEITKECDIDQVGHDKERQDENKRSDPPAIIPAILKGSVHKAPATTSRCATLIGNIIPSE